MGPQASVQPSACSPYLCSPGCCCQPWLETGPRLQGPVLRFPSTPPEVALLPFPGLLEACAAALGLASQPGASGPSKLHHSTPSPPSQSLGSGWGCSSQVPGSVAPASALTHQPVSGSSC